MREQPGATARAGRWDRGAHDGAGTGASITTFPCTDSNIYDSFGTSARKATGDPSPSLTSFVLYNVTSVSGEWTSNINGAQHFTTGTNTVGFRTNTAIGVGAESGLTNIQNSLDGDIAELILYPAKLSSGDRTALEAYIAKLYAIAVA